MLHAKLRIPSKPGFAIVRLVAEANSFNDQRRSDKQSTISYLTPAPRLLRVTRRLFRLLSAGQVDAIGARDTKFIDDDVGLDGKPTAQFLSLDVIPQDRHQAEQWFST